MNCGEPIPLQARVDTDYGHVIHIPSEAIQRSSQGKPSGTELVNLTVSVLDHSFFKVSVISFSLNQWFLHNLGLPLI